MVKIEAAQRLVASQEAANEQAKKVRMLELSRGHGYSTGRMKLTLTHKYGYSKEEAEQAIKYLTRLGLTGNPDLAASTVTATKDTSKNFAFVPNLLSATVDADDNEVRIIITTKGKPDKAVRLRIGRTVDYAAQALGLRVREQGSTQEKETWVFDYVLRP